MSKYDDLYNRVGSQIGWDFSSLKITEEGVKWDFYDLVAQYAESHPFLLDLGTGGGHRVLDIAKYFSLLVGIDSSSGMIQTAQKNLAKSNAKNAKFLQMSSENIAFPDGFFDIITARHTPFWASEVYRLLRPGGVFLCQNVTEDDKSNIVEIFGRGQGFGNEEGTLLEKDVAQLEKAGFSEITTDYYNATEYYQRPEDLMFLLQNTPIVDDFGEQSGDMDLFEKVVKENQTSKGIKTNASRSLIVAKKL